MRWMPWRPRTPPPPRWVKLRYYVGMTIPEIAGEGRWREGRRPFSFCFKLPKRQPPSRRSGALARREVGRVGAVQDLVDGLARLAGHEAALGIGNRRSPPLLSHKSAALRDARNAGPAADTPALPVTLFKSFSSGRRQRPVWQTIALRFPSSIRRRVPGRSCRCLSSTGLPRICRRAWRRSSE
jgi:hypothetical protein